MSRAGDRIRATQAKAEPSANGRRTPPVWVPSPVTLAQMAQRDYRHRWRVRRVLVADEPAIVFGPSKILKTSVIVDMCIALATGGFFLGEFPVEYRSRVLLISGESGEAALWAIARRICESRDFNPADVDDALRFECSVPPLWLIEARLILADLIRSTGSEIVVIDPAYLTLLGGGNADRASNMFAMGELLGAIATTIREAGAQLLLIHHTSGSLRIGESPGLQHIAYSGFQQFARQWLGLNRVREYEHDGRHELVMVAGGSAGHGGSWNLTIDEGVLDENFQGRKWDVTVSTAVQARENRDAEKAAELNAKAQQRNSADDQTVMTTIDRLADDGDSTTTRIRNASALSRARTDAALERLRLAKLIELHRATGRGGKAESYSRTV